jgi:hypothetical protein
MVDTPDGSDGYKLYASLDRPQRREIARAVNRGKVVSDRKLAKVAVAFARRQQKFWRYAWLIGPALGALQFLSLDPIPAAVNAAIGSGMLIGASVWFSRKAKKSERLCLELYATKKGNPAGPKNRQVPLPDVRAPYAPRGKKRRR